VVVAEPSLTVAEGAKHVFAHGPEPWVGHISEVRMSRRKPWEVI
jgi:hypothetical protein